MKTSFASLVALMAVAFSTVSALPSPDASSPSLMRRGTLAPLPAGSKDGFYAGTLNDDGTTTWKFLGADASAVSASINSTATHPIDVSAHNSGDLELERRADSGAHCDTTQLINSNDRANAATGFANMCGNGLFFGTFSITYQSGSVVAYGCNYGNGQTCHAGDVNSFLGAVASVCGGNKAGWYGKETWKASYGYTAAGVGIC